MRALVRQTAAVLLGLLVLGCRDARLPLERRAAAVVNRAAASSTPAVAPAVPGGMGDARPSNHFAYVPLQCYAKVERPGGVANPCYVCHRSSLPPNFIDDQALQVEYRIPEAGAPNRWRNALDRPLLRAQPVTDEALLAYVRQSNYFDGDGRVALATQLADLPIGWDGEADGKWDGYVPDAHYRFDREGFDQTAGAQDTGWRAFGYRPFPGAFLPGNGAMGDVLIRLDPKLRSDASGAYSRAIYRVNLALVEALVARRDVPIAETDERELGVDLDLNGVLDRATRVTFDRSAVASSGATRMRYVGAARDAIDPIRFPIAVGLFPLGTEFLHSVRYLDVEGSAVRMAPRMKELRYARKASWLSYDDLRRLVIAQEPERAESPDGSERPIWQFDRGVFNGQGWLYQGFIEAADGRLRPQSFSEMTACVGCHGGIGATADSSFSFARKLPASAPQGGWFHWSQHDLSDIADAKSSAEYAQYLARVRAADDFGGNEGARVSDLLRSTPARALAVDRAYLAIVREQRFELGRDALLSSEGVLAAVQPGGKTGISTGYKP